MLITSSLLKKFISGKFYSYYKWIFSFYSCVLYSLVESSLCLVLLIRGSAKENLFKFCIQACIASLTLPLRGYTSLNLQNHHLSGHHPTVLKMAGGKGDLYNMQKL